METTAMILNDLINSGTTLQSPLRPAGVWVQAPRFLCLVLNSTGMSCLLPFFFFLVQYSFFFFFLLFSSPPNPSFLLKFSGLEGNSDNILFS